MARRKPDKTFRDERTARRHRLVMLARLPIALIALGACYLTQAFWPAMTALVVWYAVWMIWVGGVFEHHSPGRARAPGGRAKG